MAQGFLNKFQQSGMTFPITHYSPNGYWGTQSIIEQQERIHWFLGLRQAELEIQARESALNYHRHQAELDRRALQRKTKRLRQLQRFSWLPMVGSALQDAIDDLELEIAESRQSRQLMEPMIRDALMELEVAIAHRDRIKAQHQSELEHKSFEQLQAEYTPIACLEGTARMIAAEVWSAQQGLPSVVGKALADLSPTDRQYVLQRESELRLGHQTQDLLNQATALLSTLPTEQRTTVLLRAAQLLEAETTSCALNYET